MKNPLVSIIITSYNEGNFIKKCIDSILNQNYKNFELIIVDNKSSDDTIEIIKSYKDNRIKLIVNKKISSIPKSKNFGIKIARGEYLFFTDADCIVDKNWVVSGLRSFKENPTMLGFGGKVYYGPRGYIPAISDRIRKSIDDIGFFKYRLDVRRKFYGCNFVFRAGLIKKMGGFNEKYITHEDADLILRTFDYVKFNPKLIVHHQIEKLNPRRLIKETENNYEFIICLIKDHPLYRSWSIRKAFISCPIWFFILIFPPALMFYFKGIGQKIKSLYDVYMIPFYYLNAIIIRYTLWKGAIKKKVFII